VKGCKKARGIPERNFFAKKFLPGPSFKKLLHICCSGLIFDMALLPIFGGTNDY